MRFHHCIEYKIFFAYLRGFSFFVKPLILRILCCKEVKNDFQILVFYQFLFLKQFQIQCLMVFSTKLQEITYSIFPEAHIVTFIPGSIMILFSLNHSYSSEKPNLGFLSHLLGLNQKRKYDCHQSHYLEKIVFGNRRCHLEMYWKERFSGLNDVATPAINFSQELNVLLTLTFEISFK